jgi:hypothetical protein
MHTMKPQEMQQQRDIPARRHATLTVKADTKRRIEQYAINGRWTQCALIDLLLDRYAHEFPEASKIPEAPPYI